MLGSKQDTSTAFRLQQKRWHISRRVRTIIEWLTEQTRGSAPYARILAKVTLAHGTTTFYELPAA